MSSRTLYLDGEYFAKNPAWHVKESAWKAQQVLRMLRQNRVTPESICDVGCGAGEVLKQLQANLNGECAFWGYDVSPQAIDLAKTRASETLHFELADFARAPDKFFDLILVLDVIEHLPDYFSFLQMLKGRSHYKIFHIPLDLSVQTIFRKNALLKRRDMYEHLHYFTKETALRTLTDSGYEVLDSFYTPRSVELGSTPGQMLLKLPRKLLFASHKDFAARLLGGFSFLVLAR
jgi:cyclopropane fatty-acyl-phospholipid synthase-like methyltransferase